jgi:hypothetical protein
MVSTNTRPESIVDKNGVATTRHKKLDNGTSTKRSGGAPAPKLAAGQNSRPFANDTPAEVDVPLAEIYGKIASERGAINHARSQIENYTRLVETEIAKEAKRGVENGNGGYYADSYRNTIGKLQQTVKEHEPLLAEAIEEAEPYEDEFAARGGWSRFYQVSNSNGHVHRSMNCSTCYPTTEFYWHAERSGSTDAEIVDDAGEDACTVCFPDAPVETLSRPGKMETPDRTKQREEREARAAKKIAADAAKVAKSITNPDGSPLRLGKYDLIKTERAAEMDFVDTALYAYAYIDPEEEGFRRNTWRDEQVEKMRLLSAALAAKRGVSHEEISESLKAKAVGRLKRENKDLIEKFERNFKPSDFE